MIKVIKESVIKESAFPAKLPSVYTENMYRELVKDLEYSFKNEDEYKFFADPLCVFCTGVDNDTVCTIHVTNHSIDKFNSVVFDVYGGEKGSSICKNLGELHEVIMKMKGTMK